MAKPELGTKRICPVTGKKFYDLDRDPVVSPYTGQAYPRGFFEPQVKGAAAAAVKDDEPELDGAAPELVSLDEVEAAEAGKDLPIADDIEIADDLGDDDDTFLAPDEEGEDDVTGLIDGNIESDEEA